MKRALAKTGPLYWISATASIWRYLQVSYQCCPKLTRGPFPLHSVARQMEKRSRSRTKRRRLARDSKNHICKGKCQEVKTSKAESEITGLLTLAATVMEKSLYVLCSVGLHAFDRWAATYGLLRLFILYIEQATKVSTHPHVLLICMATMNDQQQLRCRSSGRHCAEWQRIGIFMPLIRTKCAKHTFVKCRFFSVMITLFHSHISLSFIAAFRESPSALSLWKYKIKEMV